MPTAKMPTWADCIARLSRFGTVKKCSLARLKPNATAAKKMSGDRSRIVSQSR